MEQRALRSFYVKECCWDELACLNYELNKNLNINPVVIRGKRNQNKRTYRRAYGKRMDFQFYSSTSFDLIQIKI